MGIAAADGAGKEGDEDMSTSYLLDFVYPSVRQVCFLDCQVSSHHINKEGLALGYK